MVKAGLADRATLAIVAPAHNQLAQAAATAYTRQLADPHAGPIPFIPTTLEHAFAALATAGLPDYARGLHRRCTDWWLVDGELELTMTAPVADAPMPDRSPLSPVQSNARFVTISAAGKPPQHTRSKTRTRSAA